jgi:hypothetical protein
LWYIGAGLATAQALGSVFSLVTGLFLTVFVIFGVGEVVRAGALHLRVFRSGQLQRYFDADRYLIRLAVIAFACSSASVVLGQSGEQLGAGLSALGMPTMVADGLVGFAATAAIWLAVSAGSLCLRATTGYLVDRAAGVALMDAAAQTLAEETRNLPEH